MPQIVNLGRELLRINTQKNCVEYSQNGGRSWVMRCCNGSYGEFRDLLVYGRELLACTSKGLCQYQRGTLVCPTLHQQFVW